MKKLEVNYYVTKDETVVFAVPKDNWTIVARFHMGDKDWEFISTINEMVLTHEDDYYPYGEYGALLITGGVYPDEVLLKTINEFKKTIEECDKTADEAREALKDYEERTKR